MMSRNHKRTMRAFFSRYGEGPWVCSICDKLIIHLGQDTWDGQVHHVDHNFENDDPQNLEIAHTVCHLRHHLQGVPKSEEHRRKVGDRHRGRQVTWMDKVQDVKTRNGVYEPIHCGYCDAPISGGAGNIRQHQRGWRCATSMGCLIETDKFRNVRKESCEV